MAAKRKKKPSTVGKKSKGTGTPPSTAAASSSSRLSDVLVKHLGEKHAGQVSNGRSGPIRIQGVISTQCATLDAAIGRGGVPFGRVTVITGAEAGGKTTLALHILAETQRIGGVGLYLDLEHKLDVDYADAIGVNLDDVLISQPRCAEDAFGVADAMLVRLAATPSYRNTPILVVLDSINATTTLTEIEGGYDDQRPALKARFFDKALPKFIKLMSGLKVAFLMISQTRDKLVPGGSYKERISGGNAVKYYSSVAISLKRKDFVKNDGGKAIGSLVEAEVIKNQIARPFKKAEFQVVWGSGIDRELALIDRAGELGILNQGVSGWCEMPDPADPAKKIKWQGMKGFTRLQHERPELVEFLTAKVREKFDVVERKPVATADAETGGRGAEAAS